MTLKIGSAFSGYAGLDEAVKRTFDSEVVWNSEIDPHASAILRNLDPEVPNLGDITAIDWATVDPIDIFTAGYPCQPFSGAGKREGVNDPRHLWPHVRKAIRALHPKLVILENVVGHLSLGFDTVLGEMAEDGLSARWCCVRASDVGAPHMRDRLFIVAFPGASPPDSAGFRFQARQLPVNTEEKFAVSDYDVGAFPDFDGRGAALAHWASVIGVPIPRVVEPRPDGKDVRLSPRFAEWVMGVTDGRVSSAPIPYSAMIKAVGNGVCPQQAEFALRHLLPELEAK